MLDDLKNIMRRHNRTGRATAFATWAEALPRKKASGAIFWQAVRSEWSGFDRIDHQRFKKLFRRFRSSRPASFIDHLPDQILIFRGQDLYDEIGLAWTTNPDVAEGFAVGHRRIRHADPIVYDIIISREDVAFCCDDRYESEIVLLRMTKEMVRSAMRF